MNILIVEDNKAIVDALEYAFKSKGHSFYYRLNYKDAVSAIESVDVDLYILDVSLPDGNGFDLYTRYIKDKEIPTIFLTARDEENDVVYGLELGAEDYITKPFSTKELMARVNRIFKKSKGSSVINIGDIKYDFDKFMVYRDEENIQLSSLENKILNLLMLNIGKVVRREVILDKIWEWTGNFVDEHTVSVYIKRIRDKIGSDIIKTVKGIGYMIDE